jgi:hypothetical protein
MSNALDEAWVPPAPDPDSTDELISVDPRMITNHAIGQLPCPPNPRPPEGWRYWKGREKVPAELANLALKIRNDSKTYPMGAFVQILHEQELVAARVEWHDTKGATGEKGCFRGVNLMRQQEKGTV